MKRPLKSLPASKQRELDRAVEIVRESFARATSTRKAERLRDGRILKIILYGSYARGDWVEDPVGRYFSDFDLLVVVDHEDLLDLDFWEEAEARLLDELSSGRMRTPVSLILHSLDDVNWKLEHGRSFFIDIVRDGIEQYSVEGVSFSEPTPLSAETALTEAEEHFADAIEAAKQRADLAAFARSNGYTSVAAFELHQTAETLYQGLLLVMTFYVPRAHNLVRLRKMTEPLVPELATVWPHETKFQKRCFELLRAAYVKSRYSRHYRITDEELGYLTERIALLRKVVRDACEVRLETLRAEATSSVAP